MMILIEKKVLEDCCRKEIPGHKGFYTMLPVDDIISNSKEVEVMDIQTVFDKIIYERNIDQTLAQALNNKGYKLIKIKE